MAPNFNSCTSGIFYFTLIKLLKKTLNINFIVRYYNLSSIFN